MKLNYVLSLSFLLLSLLGGCNQFTEYDKPRVPEELYIPPSDEKYAALTGAIAAINDFTKSARGSIDVMGFGNYTWGDSRFGKDIYFNDVLTTSPTGRGSVNFVGPQVNQTVPGRDGTFDVESGYIYVMNDEKFQIARSDRKISIGFRLNGWKVAKGARFYRADPDPVDVTVSTVSSDIAYTNINRQLQIPGTCVVGHMEPFCRMDLTTDWVSATDLGTCSKKYYSESACRIPGECSDGTSESEYKCTTLGGGRVWYPHVLCEVHGVQNYGGECSSSDWDCMDAACTSHNGGDRIYGWDSVNHLCLVEPLLKESDCDTYGTGVVKYSGWEYTDDPAYNRKPVWTPAELNANSKCVKFSNFSGNLSSPADLKKILEEKEKCIVTDKLEWDKSVGVPQNDLSLNGVYDGNFLVEFTKDGKNYSIEVKFGLFFYEFLAYDLGNMGKVSNENFAGWVIIDGQTYYYQNSFISADPTQTIYGSCSVQWSDGRTCLDLGGQFETDACVFSNYTSQEECAAEGGTWTVK